MDGTLWSNSFVSDDPIVLHFDGKAARDQQDQARPQDPWATLPFQYWTSKTFNIDSVFLVILLKTELSQYTGQFLIIFVAFGILGSRG